MNIKVIELCSYGDTADFEAFDIDTRNLDLKFCPENWTFNGGGDIAVQYKQDDMTLEVYAEGRLILYKALSGKIGISMARSLLESWPSAKD